MSAPRVITRDRSSGRVHLRIRIGEALFADERCNFDDAGEYDEVTESELEDLDPDAFCRRCFPERRADR